MADSRKLLIAARDIGDSHKALVIARLVAELLRNAERAIERITDRAAKRRTENPHRQQLPQLNNLQLLDIGDILPDLVDILSDALFHLIHGRPPCLMSDGHARPSHYVIR